MILGDTIAAIATAPGRGGVAVVRVSGPDAFQVAERLTGRVPATGRVVFSRISSQSSLSRGTSESRQTSPSSCSRPVHLDEGLILAFKGPHSYTGEDVVEFQCHGGAVTPRRVLEACFAAGARLARRGEFTERAFLNGKLDYDQAESVLDLVDAKTARAADAALEGLAGRRRRELKSLYESALDLSTKLEHALDVDEDELPPDFLSTVASSVSCLRSSLVLSLRRANEGKILRAGALVVLAGPPNAGKSSLMNALLEENRAIVSDRPGTTRDSIEEWLDLDGWPIRLVDTAGLRETADEVEGEGVKRAEELMAKADLVLWLVDAVPSASPPTGGDKSTGCYHAGRRGRRRYDILLHSKCDLGRGPGLNVSAKTGEGLDELKRAIVAKLEEKAESSADIANVGSADIAALQEALALLVDSGEGLATGDERRETQDGRREEDLVLLANAVRSVAERLGAAIGATYSSDLLDNLFSRFCVGK